MNASSVTRISSVPGLRRFQFDCIHAPIQMQFRAISLYQIGDLICDSGFVLDPHKQSCYEISYIVSGRGWFATNGNRTDLYPGDIYLGKPQEIHQGGVDPSNPFRYYYLGFLFNTTEDEDNSFLHIQDRIDHTHHQCCRDRLDIRTPFMNALKEISSESRFSDTMLQLYLEQILVLMYRNFFSDWEAKYPVEGFDNAAKRVVYSAIHYIDDRLLQIKDLVEVSNALGYSLSYLSHQFSRETGDSLRSYVTKRKWHKAKDLLREGNHSITEIASIMQYDSIHSFSRAFRNAVGLSPSQFRERLLHND
ncbi:MAG: AraC family transcriptional regulator [Paenibacillus sp.]|nr:AraC family transcriptional regulator [Paenibacillus sp.]